MLIGKELIAEKINRAIVVYSIVCLMYQILHVITPVRLFIVENLSLFSPALAVIGFSLAVADVYASGLKYAVRGARWLYVFLAIALASSLFAYQYNLIGNIKNLIWNFVQIFVIATFAARISEKERIQVFQKLHLYASVLYVPVLLYTFYRFRTIGSHYWIAGIEQGWSGERLYGIFVTPYDGTLVVAFLALATLVRFVQCRSRIGKGILIFEEIICWIYIFLSGTRTIFAGLIAACAVIVCLFFRRRYLAGRHGMFVYITAGAAVFLLCVPLMVGVGQGLKLGFVEASKMTSAQQKNAKEIRNLDIKLPDIKRLMGRLGSTDSSGRTWIWNSYFAVFFDKPSHLLTGISPKGYDVYIYDKYSNNRLVKSMKRRDPKAYKRKELMPPHNTYIYVLITTGIFGFSAMMLFLLRILADGGRIIWTGYAKPQVLVPLLSVIMLLVMCLFETEVFLQVRVGALIFWIAVGYLSAYLSESGDGKGKKAIHDCSGQS